MDRHILLTTIGSLGDLLPVLALARALEDRSVPVRLLLTPEDVAVAASHGLAAEPFGPSAAEVSRRLGMTRSEVAASIFRNPSPLLRAATYPMLADLTRAMLPHVEGARAVAGTALAMAGPLAAEMAGRPYVSLLLQPTLLQSALDPPRILGFCPPMVPHPRNAVARGLNRGWLRVVRTEMRRRHGRDQNRVRHDLGLPPSRATPLFDAGGPPALRLGLWDPAFHAVPPDVGRVALTGFARAVRTEPLPVRLAAFLEAGPPPLVVTLGSVAHSLGGADFWQGATALARGAGLRAVLLAGDEVTPEGPDILALPYADHAALFPRAAAILHHGGMGTLGQALHAGRPQLILPIGADQPDNARRAEGLGVARRIRRVGHKATHRALREILSIETRTKARHLSQRLVPDGGAMAADTMLEALGRD